MDKPDLSLEEAALAFLTSLPAEERKEKQQEVSRFVLWYGKERRIGQMTPVAVASYAESVGTAGGDTAKRLEPVRALLTYARKEKLIKASLAPHLRIKQAPSKTAKAPAPAKPKPQTALTSDDYAQLKSQLASLQEDRIRVAEEMRIAAADKDFRENAPLQAAREKRDHIEARMQEIQATIANGVVVEAGKPAETLTVKLGCRVVLRDLNSGRELTYTLVTKNEADPVSGKISIISPIGKALLNQACGASVRVVAPARELRYQIERIE
jgi:transcription elongation factor GreA